MGIYEDLGNIASLLTPEVIWLNIVFLTAAAFVCLSAAAAAGSVLLTLKLPPGLKRWADARLRSLEARLPAAERRDSEDCRTGVGLARAAPAVLDALLTQPVPAPATREAPAAGPAAHTPEPGLAVPLPGENRPAIEAAVQPR